MAEGSFQEAQPAPARMTGWKDYEKIPTPLQEGERGITARVRVNEHSLSLLSRDIISFLNRAERIAQGDTEGLEENALENTKEYFLRMEGLIQRIGRDLLGRDDYSVRRSNPITKEELDADLIRSLRTTMQAIDGAIDAANQNLLFGSRENISESLNRLREQYPFFVVLGTIRDLIQDLNEVLDRQFPEESA